MQLNIDKIKELIERRFLNVPESIKNVFPKVLKGEIQWVASGDDSLAILYFLDSAEMARIKEYSSKGLQLFPGFITTQEGVGAGMRMNNSKYGFISGCAASGTYSFSVGENTSFIVQDHIQELKTNELGDIKYLVPLAYVVSFGDDSSQDDVYENFDDLISYSIKTWRESSELSS